MKIIKELFANQSESSRTAFYVGLAMILLLLMVAIWWLLRPGYQMLFGNLREADAAEIAKTLTEWKVPYQFTDNGASIEVPTDAVYDTRMKLVSAGVPSGGHIGFEIFNEADFGVTEFSQRVNYQRAIQGELERSISTLPGVNTVRIHLTIRRPGLFIGKNDNSKASVALTFEPGQQLSAQQVGGIKNLVASAVEGLSPESVVVMGPGGVLKGGAVSASSSDSLFAQTEELSGYETRVKERITDLLTQALKGQEFRVSVDARLNFDRVQKVSQRLIAQGSDGNGLVQRKRISRNSTPSAAAEAATASTQQSEELDYAHSTEREEIVRAPGQVERMSIAVLVPAGLTGSEIERLRKLVIAAAGMDMSRGDQLEISSLAGAIRDVPVLGNSLSEPTVIEPGMIGTAEGAQYAATSSWRTGHWAFAAAGGLIGILLGALLFSRRVKTKTIRPEERDAIAEKVRAWIAEGGVA
jgi:flagellar M-ring protein FliF